MVVDLVLPSFGVAVVLSFLGSIYSFRGLLKGFLILGILDSDVLYFTISVGMEGLGK